MRAASPGRQRTANSNRSRRGLWTVAFLTLGLLAAFLTRETARSLRGSQPIRQVLALAPGISVGGSDAPAAGAAQLIGEVNEREGPDERELLDEQPGSPDEDRGSGGAAAADGAAPDQEAGPDGDGSAAQQTAENGANGDAAKPQAASSAAAAAPATRTPKVKPGQLAAENGSADTAAADVADADADAERSWETADAKGKPKGSKPEVPSTEGSGSSGSKGQAKEEASPLPTEADPAAAAASDDAAEESEAADGNAGPLGGADAAAAAAEGGSSPKAEPARDSFPAQKMQAAGREAAEAKWAAEEKVRQQQAGAAAAAGQQAAPSHEGESGRDGAADGSTQPVAPVATQVAGGDPAGGRQSAGQDPAALRAAAFVGQLLQLKPQVLDERQLDTGIIHYGDMARVRSFMHKLRHDQPVHIAVVGGSISVGLGEDGFGPGLFRRIAAAFPHPGHRFHNGALGGVMSTYMNSCLKWHVPTDIDLVVVEFNCNDGFETEYCSELPCTIKYGGLNTMLRRGYERLLRKLLMLPRRPAVIMLQTFDFSDRLFMNSGEDQLGVFAQLYSIPWLSFRGVVWKRQQRSAPGYSISELMLPGGGDKHPNPYGHQMLADLVAGLLQRAGEGLLTRPFTPADQAIVDEDLLDPVLPGNIAWDDEYCFIDDKFREKVTESPGFKWIDEAQPHHLTKKEGFVATKPGAHLLLTINTAETTKTDVQDPHTVVTINHLRSYEHMGQAEVTCVSGCKCNSTIIDGHWAQKNSQLSMHRFSVSQAKECTLKITVLEATSSGEHKVKIQGLVVSDEAMPAGQLPALMPQIIPSDIMGAARLERGKT